MRISLSLAAALAVVSPSLAAQETTTAPIVPNTGWSIVRCDLEVTIEPAQHQVLVAGTLRLRLTSASADTVTIGVNARQPLMQFLGAHCRDATVTLNALHPMRSMRRLAHFTFARSQPRGTEVDVSFECEQTANGRQLAVTEKIAFASWVEAWYPIAAPPKGVSLGGASRAPGETRFILPAGWSAVTNGRLVSREETANGCVEVWNSERALSRSFAAAPFEVTRHRVAGLDVSLFMLSDAVTNPKRQVAALADAISAMEKRFGPYPYPSYAIAEVPAAIGEFGAASEQGFILVKPMFLRVPDGNLPLFAHEAAHAWWGNIVGTSGPGGLMCSEALAQYGAALAIETLEGDAAATEFLRFSRKGYIPLQCARGYFELARTQRDRPLAELRSGQAWDHTLSDAKGHWVYHMLRRRVGDEIFFATLQQLVARFETRSMSLRDVRNAFEAAAPDAGLEQFFAQWLDRPGAPELACTWEQDGEAADLTLHQRQAGDPFDLHVELDLHLADGSVQRHAVHLASTEQRFSVAVGGPVERVDIDPEHRLLIWTPEYGAAPSAAPAAKPEKRY